MLNRLKIYWTVWKTVAQYGLAETFINRWTNLLFFVGKFFRFGMILLFLFLLRSNTKGIAGYTPNQVVIFYLSYQILDTLTQMFFRGVYLFSWQVKSGELDFYLSKPLNPLFRILTGKPDLIDAIFFVPTTAITIWLMSAYSNEITTASILLYLSLLVNGFLIATAFHILVICLGVVTTEVDNAVMLYRDLNAFSRLPIDIYKEPLRTIFFLVIPVGLMNTIPAQILLNVQPSYSLALTYGFGVGFFALSILAWRKSIKKYTSAGG